MTLLPIALPKEAISIVKVSDKISEGQIVAQIKIPGSQDIIKLSDYQISQKEIESSLKKHLGDAVLAGDIIAIKKKMIGGTKILSKTSGTIAKIDIETTDVYIKSNNGEVSNDIISPVEGIVDFCNNEKIVIKTDKQIIIAKDALGQNVTGELLVGDFAIQSLNSEISGKILVTETLDKTSFYKAFGLGAKGIIAVDLKDLDFLDFENNSMQEPVFLISEEDFKKIKKNNGKKVFGEVKTKGIMIL